MFDVMSVATKHRKPRKTAITAAPATTVSNGTNLRLNLGAGDSHIEGLLNVDRKYGGEAYPLKLNSGHLVEPETCELIRASHLLEHFSYTQTIAVMCDWVKALKPGGILKVAVPDFENLVEMYETGSDNTFEQYLMGGHVDENDHHGAIFNAAKLFQLFEVAGLTDIKGWESEITDSASYPFSLNLQGTKGKAEIHDLQGVSAVLSMPRYCFTQNILCLLETQQKLKIKMRVRQGVYWEQTLTQAIELTLEQDRADYILTIDFDTIFKPEHVRELYRLMMTHPEVDAVCGMQIGRDRDAPLITVKDGAGQNRNRLERSEADQELLKVSTGHFGLTLIRVSSLAQLPRPWFKSIPDEHGSWGDGRLDADIYFWKKWDKQGLSLYQANQVRLGHYQDVVTIPDINMEPVHVYSVDFRDKKFPPGVNW